MATNVFQIFLCIFLITLAFPLPSHARRSKTKAENQTSFDFTKNLEGSKKGQTIKGLQQVRKYLERYGYLNYSPNQIQANDDNFDDALEAAVRTYQLNYHLNATGTLDAQTLTQMMVPRCGVPDITNGTNWMLAHDALHNASHYSFYDPSRSFVWPQNKFELTYGFQGGFPRDFIPPVSGALDAWASMSVFTFTRTSYRTADIKIRYCRGDHGDGYPFTGPPNGVLGHSFPPTDGRFHINSDYLFSVNPVEGSYHLGSMALHEIGHLLGLGHSNVEQAIMYASLSPGTVKDLHFDDYVGISTLYNF